MDMVDVVNLIDEYEARRKTKSCVMAKADEYRERAEECRRKAETAVATRDKEAWLGAAEQWLLMAQNSKTRSENLN